MEPDSPSDAKVETPSLTTRHKFLGLAIFSQSTLISLSYLFNIQMIFGLCIKFLGLAIIYIVDCTCSNGRALP
jgi:hypothetical protein